MRTSAGAFTNVTRLQAGTGDFVISENLSLSAISTSGDVVDCRMLSMSPRF